MLREADDFTEKNSAFCDISSVPLPADNINKCGDMLKKLELLGLTSNGLMMERRARSNVTVAEKFEGDSQTK